MGKRIDLAGQRFGRLVAIEPTDKRNKQGLVMWKFQCDCGNIIERPGAEVKKGHILSCGCLKTEVLIQRNLESSEKYNIGDRFGYLTIIEDLGLRKQQSRDKREAWVKCQCDCGTIIETRVNNLKTGMTKSCGCIKSRGETIIRALLNKYNINYAVEYTFSDLIGDRGNKYRFDFAIFDNKGSLYELIEFDGRQHYTGSDSSWTKGSDLETIQRRDAAKTNYCNQHNIKLIRIPYYDIGKIDLQLLGLEDYIKNQGT